MYVSMVAAGITVHYQFALFDAIPTQRPALQEMTRFAVDYTLFLNITFGVVAALLLWLHFSVSSQKVPVHASVRSRSTSLPSDDYI